MDKERHEKVQWAFAFCDGGQEKEPRIVLEEVLDSQRKERESFLRKS
jgi:hypothetical protein